VTEPTAEEAGYASMLAELEGILTELEHRDVDVDLLAERVARAAALVEACRDRIERARLEVERVVASIDPPTETD
jgi:exodeoxyribonuclease VII small subunit